MSRKSVILCLCVVLVLVIANALAIAFLYAPSFAHREAVRVSSDSTSVASVAAPVKPFADSAALSHKSDNATVSSSAKSSDNAVASSVAKSSDNATVSSSAKSSDNLAESGASKAGVKNDEKAGVKVEVPRGPFEVKNCATGLMNKLSQADDNSLSLTDQRGNVLWTVPFEGRLSGMVGTVDYFANGKLQFLFASGDKLWLYDRLGRVVKGFPSSLEKTVLLGPAVYDFNGTHKYNIVVLNTDNTLDMYNLQGRRPDGWKTISPSETILALPDRLKQGGRDYWVVRTKSKNYVYDFYGNQVKVFDGEVKINEL